MLGPQDLDAFNAALVWTVAVIRRHSPEPSPGSLRDLDHAHYARVIAITDLRARTRPGFLATNLASR